MAEMNTSKNPRPSKIPAFDRRGEIGVFEIQPKCLSMILQIVIAVAKP